jgi:hypothetical protein
MLPGISESHPGTPAVLSLLDDVLPLPGLVRLVIVRVAGVQWRLHCRLKCSAAQALIKVHMGPVAAQPSTSRLLAIV